MVTWPRRSFPPGSPGMPVNGLLVGGGGGFTWQYVDYALHADGRIEQLQYMTESGPIPDDYSTTGRGTSAPEVIVDFDDKLVANGFWSLELKPPTSEELEYLVAVNEKKGSHSVVWAKGATDVPEAIRAIRNDVLEYATKIVESQA